VDCFRVKEHTEETKQLISNTKKGRKQTKEHIEKVRLRKIGTKQPDSQKIKTAEKLSHEWLLTDIKGNTYKIKNLRKFCLENKLDQGNMVKVSCGHIKQSKGWKCINLQPK
jgi:hypothetical protein